MFEVLQSCVWIYEYICQKIYTLIKIEDFWINNLVLQGELQKFMTAAAGMGLHDTL